MENEEFEKILNDRIAKIKSVLQKKAGEYASSEDRLYNFKKQALFKEESQAQALWGNFTKQLISVSDMVDGNMSINNSTIDEKIGDCINYLILLEGVFRENLELSEKTKKGGKK